MLLSKVLRKIKDIFVDITPKHKLKIAGFKFSSEHGYNICIIQLAGKNIFPEIDPSYLLSHPEILQDFSPNDIVAITRLADKNEKSKKSKKLSIKELFPEASSERNKLIVKEFGIKQYKILDIKNFDTDKSMLRYFSQEEAYLLGQRREKIEVIEEKEAIKLAKDELLSGRRKMYLV